jgi:hypothetical protein
MQATDLSKLFLEIKIHETMLRPVVMYGCDP